MFKKTIITVLMIFGMLFCTAGSAFAASLRFDPTTVSTTSGQTFGINIVVDAGSDQISSVDAYVVYDASLLETQRVDNGSFFPTVSNVLSSSGKAYIAGTVVDAATYKTGSGTIATLWFKAKADGTVTLKYDCTQGSSVDSNVSKNDLNATDLLVCSGNGTSIVTIGSGSGSTVNPTATPTTSSGGGSSGGSTSGNGDSAPETLPQTGTLDNVSKYFLPGALLLVVGGVIKLLL